MEEPQYEYWPYYIEEEEWVLDPLLKKWIPLRLWEDPKCKDD